MLNTNPIARISIKKIPLKPNKPASRPKKRSRKFLLSVLAFFIVTNFAHAIEPANSNSSPQARAVLQYLKYLESNNQTISGQLELTNDGGLSLSNGNHHATLAHTRTGKWVGIIGAQWDPGSSLLPSIWQDQFQEYWQLGGIPHLTSMPRNPRNTAFGRFWNSADLPGSETGTFYINMGDLLSDGPRGSAYNTYYNDLDSIAAELEVLNKNGVPILFRPFPECNGPWFWWGNRTGFLTSDPDRYEEFKQLWKETFNYLTYTKNLNNLLWVFESANPDSPSKRDSIRPNPELIYPGDDYVDIIAMNSTVAHDEPMDKTIIWPEAYNWMVSRGKPVGFSQCGVRKSGSSPQADNMKVLDGLNTDFQEVSWWMAWRDHFSIARNLNNDEMLSNSRVVNRGDLPNFNRFEINSVANSAYTITAANGSNGTLDPGDRAVVQANSNWSTQRWLMESSNDGFYELKNENNPNLVLTVVDSNGGGINNGDQIKVDTDFNGERQRWLLRPVGNQRFELVSKKNQDVILGLNLGANGIVSAGDGVNAESDSSQSWQRWILTMPEVD